MRRELFVDSHYGRLARRFCRALCLEREEGLSPLAASREAHGNALRNTDLLAWGRYFLPEYFRLTPSEMHRWLAAELDAASHPFSGAECPSHSGPGTEYSVLLPSADNQSTSQDSNSNGASSGPLAQPLNEHDDTSSFSIHHSSFSALKLNCVGPRGSAKSTVVTLAFVLREALARRQPYIWIVSDTRHQAASHLDAVKAELTENPLLAAMYTHACGVGPVWRRGAIVLRNGVMIEAFGTGQRIRGRRRKEHRPTLIVCDDLQNDGHIQSANLRDQSRAWFHGLLMKAGTKRTTIINLGTALHRECLAMELTHTPGWTSRTFKAIERWPDHMPLWAAWEELYCQPQIFDATTRGATSFSGRASGPQEPSAEPNNSAEFEVRSAESQASVTSQSELLPLSELSTEYSVLPPHSDTESPHQDSNSAVASSGPLARPLNGAREFYLRNETLMHLGARLLWPAEEDLYMLMCMRAESGHTAFEREKQSVPLNPDACEWPADYFGDAIWFDEWPTSIRIRVIALDPSKGTDARRGDYSAFVMLAVGADGVLYFEADLKRRPTPQIVSDGIELCRRFSPHALGVESNQFQELLGFEFAAELARQGLVGVVPCSIDNRVSKSVRIRRLGPLLARRSLRFKTDSPGTRMLVDQLKEFPTASHDDGPDAAEMALRLAENYLRPIVSDGLGDRLVSWN